MEIRAFSIVNFRPFRRLEADLTSTEGHIHLIEGPQGAGKTSLHKALRWAYYGGRGATHNYKCNWNEQAREDDDEEMFVSVKVLSEGTNYTIERSIKRFNRHNQTADEELKVVGPEKLFQDRDAQDFIDERLPKELHSFFFLDGERIQNLISEKKGREVKHEIETVLKHQAILNADEDLRELKKEYERKRDTIEDEKQEREELLTELQEFREELEGVKRELDENRETQRKLRNDIEAAQELLEEHDEKTVQELRACNDRLHRLKNQIGDKAVELRESWERLPIAILHSEIHSALEKVRKNLARCDNHLRQRERADALEEFREKVKNEGECPVCGTREPARIERRGNSLSSEAPDRSRDELIQRRAMLADMESRLKNARGLDDLPGALEHELTELRKSLDSEEKRKTRLLSDYGGALKDSEKQRLQDSIREWEARLVELDGEQDRLRKDQQRLQAEIKKCENDMQKKAGQKELSEVYDKIDVVSKVRQALKAIRTTHIQAKRDRIREEMNRVFASVSKSDFISNRYKGIDFRGEADSEDEYVLQLVKSDGSRKNMVDHPPSAGETQLVALSFIFGLNKYAKYSATIVFDTVAARLDLDNAEAQGQFFTTLDEPIILLVTDSELRDLGPAVGDAKGVHYRLRPDAETNPVLEEVTR